MKVKKDVVTGLFYVAAIIQLTSCDEQKVNPTKEGTSITESFRKIETSYEVGNEKIEGLYVGDKVETQAPPEYISTIRERVNREINAVTKTSRFRSARTSAIYDGYDVGVIPASFNKNTIGDDCPSWSEKITIFMDCEDSQSATSISGDPAGSSWWSAWSTDGFNKNLLMIYCRVDGRLFQADMLPGEGMYEYALLKLGYQSLPMASLVVRYFDNEDNSNNNYYQGDISPNVSDRNTKLNFHYFWTTGSGDPSGSGGIAFPNLGFSYGVFGRNTGSSIYSPLAGEKVNIDDEDSSNANWKTPSSYTGPIGGGSNTILYLARMK